MDLSKMSGLEIIALYVDGTLPLPEIAKVMPMTEMTYGYGFVEISVCADERHLNPFGVISGGFCATVMDAAIATAVYTKLTPGNGYSTTEFSIKFISSVPANIPLKVKAKVISMTKRFGIGEAVICDTDNKIYAH